MKIKTSELSGAALDWAVAKCKGFDYDVVDGAVLTGDTVMIGGGDFAGCHADEVYAPSTNWAQGGPILDKLFEEGFRIERVKGDCVLAANSNADSLPLNGIWETPYIDGMGPTVLIACMRAYVASKLGNEIEIPNELL